VSKLLRFLSDSKYPTTPKQGSSASESELLGGFEESPLSAAGRSMGAAVSHNRRSYAGRVKTHMMQRKGSRRATQALQRPALMTRHQLVRSLRRIGSAVWESSCPRMSDFTAAPYRGDPGIPHAEEASYTVRSRSAALCPQCGGRFLCRWSVQHVHIACCTSVRGDLGSSALSDLWFLSQVFIGGCWVSLGLQYLKDITEFRPMFRRVVQRACEVLTVSLC
jgi:hypothetical protein